MHARTLFDLDLKYSRCREMQAPDATHELMHTSYPADTIATGRASSRLRSSAGHSRSSKGAAMRRYSVLLLLILTLVFSLAIVACGDGDSVSKLSPLGPSAAGEAEQSVTEGGDAPSAAEVFAAVATNNEPMTSAVGTFDLTIDLDVDSAAMGEEEAAFFEDPWKLSGSMAFETTTKVADVSLKLNLMDQDMDIGIKTLGEQAWMALGGKWYEAPPEMMESMGAATEEGLDVALADIQNLFTETALDPIAWFKNQEPVKVEEIDGDTVYHLAGSDPDWSKVVADLAKLMQNPKFMEMMGEAGELSGDMIDPSEMPTQEELQEMQSMLESLVDELEIDLWVQKDNSRLRKATIAMQMTPPSEEDMAALDAADLSGMDFEGLNSISMAGTINLDPDETVKVSPPDSARSFDDLQTDIMEDPSMLGPFGMLLMGAMGGMGESGFDSF